jgi:hypothetical protein
MKVKIVQRSQNPGDTRIEIDVRKLRVVGVRV